MGTISACTIRRPGGSKGGSGSGSGSKHQAHCSWMAVHPTASRRVVPHPTTHPPTHLLQLQVPRPRLLLRPRLLRHSARAAAAPPRRVGHHLKGAAGGQAPEVRVCVLQLQQYAPQLGLYGFEVQRLLLSCAAGGAGDLQAGGQAGTAAAAAAEADSRVWWHGAQVQEPALAPGSKAARQQGSKAARQRGRQSKLQEPAPPGLTRGSKTKRSTGVRSARSTTTATFERLPLASGACGAAGRSWVAARQVAVVTTHWNALATSASSSSSQPQRLYPPHCRNIALTHPP